MLYVQNYYFSSRRMPGILGILHPQGRRLWPRCCVQFMLLLGGREKVPAHERHDDQAQQRQHHLRDDRV